MPAGCGAVHAVCSARGRGVTACEAGGQCERCLGVLNGWMSPGLQARDRANEVLEDLRCMVEVFYGKKVLYATQGRMLYDENGAYMMARLAEQAMTASRRGASES